MHGTDLSLATVAVVTVAILSYTVYAVHRSVTTYASYPQDITFNGTYRDKLHYTLTTRIDTGRTAALLGVLLVAGNGLAVVVLSGLLHFTG